MSAGDGRRQTWVEWISVKDRLPPCAETVLAYTPETGLRLRAFYLPFGCAHTEIFWPGWHEDTRYGDQPRIETEVTHWMELPPGPEGA